MYSYKVKRIGSSTWVLKRYKDGAQLSDGKRHVKPEYCERDGKDWLWSMKQREKLIGVN